MATNYLCAGCNKTFEGRDPIRIPDQGIVVLASCPEAERIAADARSKATYNTYEDFLQTQKIVDAAQKAHPVKLAIAELRVAPVAAPSGAWGAKPRITQETPEEKRRREQAAALAAQQEKQRKAAEAIDTAARNLVHRIDRAIATGSGGKSARFALDLEYGTRKGGHDTQTLEVITAASRIWLNRGADYRYRAPQFKQVWKLHMANFEKAIVSGNWSAGKHNYHVVLQ